MRWKKMGHIYSVNAEYFWNKSHAQCPVVDILNSDIWRIYYATRDIKGRSRISYIEVEAGNPQKILYKNSNYLFDLGNIGTFDDSGLMPTCIVNVGNLKYLYYIGWTTKISVPYHNSVGLAVSSNGGKDFKRAFKGPIIGTINTEPYFSGTAYVLIENSLWRMWYLSCTGWIIHNNKLEPKYHIKYAESNDGIHWKRDGIVAIDYKSIDEGGIVSASVLKEDNIYKMWYAYRNAINYRDNNLDSYRIGYAESLDGIVWNRLDEEAGIDKSPEGWDSEMISYPYVIKYHKEKYMFYNGNGFGKSGFGYVKFEIDGK